ncbi:MAG: exodeoxyribonuclease VII small subunit [Oscillatoriophycideae cyanobacterium NC_groundwater_1537_Pr4_S-0.65um_50_18]|nr:exodeoxyribonuclease VII small subunit [Oscillatoriophycideae cyanobacterium NC_groundwater_1537_Pr4_S-0.65um_50_18]
MNDASDLPQPPLSTSLNALESETIESASLKNSKTAPGSSDLPVHWNYETTVAEIETIINRIELGELELADVFEQFSVAMERLRQCEAFLMRQQQQVDLLIETLVDQPEGF